MAAKRKKYDDDDGRVIAKMNVEGMPWYTPGQSSTLAEDEKAEENEGPKRPIDELSKAELFSLCLDGAKVGCVFGLIMAGVLTLAGIIAFFVLGGWTKFF